MSQEMVKKGASLLVRFGAASAVPVLVASGSPLLAPLAAILPFLLSKDEEGKTPIDKAFGGVASALTELLGKLTGDALDDFWGEQDASHNQDLSRAFAAAYLAALKAVQRDINRGNDAQLKVQFNERLPLWRKRIAHSRKKDPASLFALRNSKEALLKVSEDETKDFAEAIKETLGQWLAEQRNAEQTGESGLVLNAEALPEPLQSALIEKLVREIPAQFGEILKRSEFARAWISFQREHLQHIVRVLKKLEAQNASIKEDTQLILKRLGELDKLPEEGFSTLAEMTSEILQLSREQEAREEFREEIIAKTVQRILDLEKTVREESEKTRETVKDEGLKGRITTREEHERSREEIPRKVLETFQQAGMMPQPTVVSVPRSLPAKPPFFGEARAQQLDRLAEKLLSDAPLAILIQGGASVGKTNLSLQLLHHPHSEQRFGQRRYFISCETTNDAVSLVRQIADDLGIVPAPNQKREDQIVFMLKAEPALLALDNLETPWDTADKTMVENLLAKLAQVDKLKLVASIRGRERPLNVRWHCLELQMLEPQQARRLFLEISPEFASDPDLDDWLCEMSYLPGAIRLLAAAAQGESRLQSLRGEYLRLLNRGDGKDNDLIASYELSLKSERMVESPEALRLLRVMAVLPGGISEASISALLPEDGKRAASVLRKAALVDSDVVSNRHSLLNPLRQYLLDQYQPDADDLKRVIEHYLKLVNDWAPKMLGSEGSKAIEILLPEVTNIEAMFEAGNRKVEDWWFIRAALDWGLFVYGSKQGSSRPVELALELARKRSREDEQADCLKRLGDCAFGVFDYVEAKQQYKKALKIYERIGSALGEANCLQSLGDCALRVFDYVEAKQQYEKALPIFKRIGDALGEANCLQSLGEVAIEETEILLAKELFEGAKKISGKISYTPGVANCEMGLGRIATAQNEFEAARSFLENARSRYQEMMDETDTGECEIYFGDLALKRGDTGGARKHYEDALALLTQCNAHHYIAEAHRRLAWVSDEPERTTHRKAAMTIWIRRGIEEARVIERLDRK
jgi:tetratricopeptide (TPR) repeat protein